MNIRLATAADLDAMTWVLVAASPLDPIYPYRFPDRHLYANEFRELCRQKCAEYLATNTVIVCEMPVHADLGRTRVVAFCVWDLPKAHAHQPLNANVGEPISRPANNPVVPVMIGRRDRMNVFRDKCASSKRDLFDARFTRGHMFLKILLCHPDYQRRGAGRALTAWGIDEARRLGLYTTVFASPMGFALYRKLGFREIGRFRVQLDGDDLFLEIPALILGPDEGEGVQVGLEVSSQRRGPQRQDMDFRYQHEQGHHKHGHGHGHGHGHYTEGYGPFRVCTNTTTACT